MSKTPEGIAGEEREPIDDKPPELGTDAIQILEGSTFVVSDVSGDVPEGAVGGLFHRDTRHLSRWELRVGGKKPDVLTSGTVDYYSASFNLTNPELPGLPPKTLSVQRYRLVGGGLHERIRVENHLTRPARVELRLRCGADFADLFQVKEKATRKEGAFTSSHGTKKRPSLSFHYENGDFRAGTRLHSSEPARIEGNDLVYDLRLDPRASWTTTIRVAVSSDGTFESIAEELPPSERRSEADFQKWREDVPKIDADTDLMEHVYRKSVVDLAGLRLIAPVRGYQASLPAAGLPWFMAIFGRDTLVTSYQSMWVSPELARGALTALAALQGTEVNDFKDEEPGKIMHEIRHGELTALQRRPHSPYYGSIDATPLWLVLLSEYWRWTGDGATCWDLKASALRALEWIDRFGDRDGDGYLEYDTRSSQGLANQGWKDSWNGVIRHDGSMPPRPIALCEVQGYVYDAKLRVAELADRVWGEPEMAVRLRDEAGQLKERFDRDFWSDERGGFYVLGLDGHKGRIDAKTSNMGHLLWSGIVPEDRAQTVVRQLFAESMFTGWGIRTLSSENLGFNPIGYHLGTVWPHDNSLISVGLLRYGFRQEAARIAMAMFEAAGYTDYRLPEAFAGYPRTHGRFPIRYPTACYPQAWATAAPFLWLKVLLGLEVIDGELRCDPYLPKQVRALSLQGVHACGARFNVQGEKRSGRVSATG